MRQRMIRIIVARQIDELETANIFVASKYEAEFGKLGRFARQIFSNALVWLGSWTASSSDDLLRPCRGKTSERHLLITGETQDIEQACHPRRLAEGWDVETGSHGDERIHHGNA